MEYSKHENGLFLQKISSCWNWSLFFFFLLALKCKDWQWVLVKHRKKVFGRQDCVGGWVAGSMGEPQIWGALMSLFGAQLCVYPWRLKSIRDLLGGQGSTSTATALCIGEARVAHLNLIFSTEWGLWGNQAPQDRSLESPEASKHAVQPSLESPTQSSQLEKDL